MKVTIAVAVCFFAMCNGFLSKAKQAPTDSFGYCYAPDHVIAVDRHVATAYNSSGFAVELCESAPSTCAGPGANAVRCFKPSCREGEEPHCGAGACCAKCTPAR